MLPKQAICFLTIEQLITRCKVHGQHYSNNCALSKALLARYKVQARYRVQGTQCKVHEASYKVQGASYKLCFEQGTRAKAHLIDISAGV